MVSYDHTGAVSSVNRGGMATCKQVDRNNPKDPTPLEALAFYVHGPEPSRAEPSRPITILRALWLLHARGGRYRAVTLIRLSQHFDRPGRRRLRDWARRQLSRDYGCFLQVGAQIGPGLKLPHPQGIVIGAGTRVGRNCVLYQQVTLGGARRGDFAADRYPVIGDDVVVFAGAKLLGAVRVGNGACIGANAVVIRDVPAGRTAVGVPARLLP